jgi:hypothetical protein
LNLVRSLASWLQVDSKGSGELMEGLLVTSVTADDP